MDNLIDQLIIRWEQAFEDIQKLPAFKAAIKTIKYAEGSRYNLEKFDQHSFPADGPLSQEKQNHEYGFNDQGLPCYVAFSHEYNKLYWEGYYQYTDNLAEYIEFNTNTGTPSAITRVLFENGRKTATQRLVVNGRGTIYAHLKDDRAALIEKIKEDTHALFLTATSFEYNQDGNIIRSTSTHVTPGVGTYNSHDEYTYLDNQLDKIRTFDAEGNSRLTFSRNSANLSPQALVEKLATAMAEQIVRTLQGSELELPLAFLELGYHYADNYLPLLGIQSRQQVEQRLKNKELVFFTDNYLDSLIDIAPFEDLFAQMEQLMEEHDDMNIGRTALRKTAAILTKTKLFGKINTTADFAAYAIDWSIEGHSNEDLEEILLECGVEKETLAIWKENNFLSE
ncbi:hypothetical protein [Chitinophaga silvisoli]|uniref:Uncharacterized protein n=1 Tax=Chitinophaga silvisoli TaxID=2291814 RepID=A0A3E1P784_9BACT|nr:hypothetical protein [Chitinophaga silvisoli]RFM36046.1 hypothetical protein DXN04_00585 [Chitinophaga silvisoli]